MIGLGENSNESSGTTKCGEFLLLFEDIVASQEGP